MKPHRIKPCSGNARPEHIIFFDIETTQRPLRNGDIAQDFRFGMALYWRRSHREHREREEWYTIESPERFWDWVVSKLHGKCVLYLMSHNLNIDLVAVDAFRELPKRGYLLRSLYVKGMTKLIYFGNGRSTLKCLDNANWWRAPLAELGELVGYPKLDVNPLNASLEELAPYCKRDVEILYHLWRGWFNFIDDHDLGNWGATIGSQAMYAYRHRFMHHDIYVHDNPLAIYLERQAYHGGRVEPFWVGEWNGDVRHLVDVNSMYPYVMRNYDYPTALRSIVEGTSLDRLESAIKRHLVIADCDVEVSEPVYPLEDRLGAIYPLGRFRVCLTTPEVEYGLERGYIRQVHRMAVYRKAPIFRDYVDYFYPLKDKYTVEGNQVYRASVKMMLNCLYGKFGQRGSKRKLVGSCRPDLCRIETWIDAGDGRKGVTLWLGGSIIDIEETELSYNSFVAIAAHCTAYARMYLWSLIALAGIEHCYYCDTDSLIVDDVGLERLSPLLDDHRLGALKLEGSYSDGCIRGKKDYRLGNRIVLKGIPSSAVPISDNAYAFDLWPSIRGMLRNGDLSQYYIRPSTRTLSHRLYWGIRESSGRIRPYWVEPLPGLDESGEMAIWELEMEIASLREAKTIPQPIVFTYWDYREGELRSGSDDPLTAPRYRGIPIDIVAHEHGYDDYRDLLGAIEKQVELDHRIKRLENRLRSLVEKRPTGYEYLPFPPESAPLPF
jgi:hypothetical protein